MLSSCLYFQLILALIYTWNGTNNISQQHQGQRQQWGIYLRTGAIQRVTWEVLPAGPNSNSFIAPQENPNADHPMTLDGLRYALPYIRLICLLSVVDSIFLSPSAASRWPLVVPV